MNSAKIIHLGINMHRTNIQIRFRDTDGMGHINNAVFLTYLELARIEFFKTLFEVKESHDISFILARVEIDFRIPINLKDEPVVVLWVKTIGNTSWVFGYSIVDANDNNKIFANATSVQVVFNYKTNQKENITPDFRTKLERYIQVD